MEAARIENLNAVLEQHGYGQPVLIGKGSFSRVYRIRDRAGHFWACRVSEATGRWQQECINWKEISHPLFPAYREQWTEGTYGYLIIEFWEGMDLQEFLRRRKRLSPEQAAVIVGQLTEGLQYLHERSHPFLYRDLKPENIMLQNFYYETTEEPIQVVILDFDLSWHKGATELTVALGAMSQGFMAPEQVQENEHYKRNTAVDVYSIGMLAYFILVGKNPAPYQHQFRNYEVDMEEMLTKRYKNSWRCLPSFLKETIYNATLHEPERRASLASFIYNMKVALDIVLADEIEYSNPLLLREIAYRIENNGKYEIKDFGRELIMKQEATGKSITMNLTQCGKRAVIKVHLEKMRMGQDLRAPKYLENAIN